MAADRPGRFGPEAIARTTFQTSFRGYDTEHVRAFLDELAEELREQRDREAALRKQVEMLEAKVAAGEHLDEARITEVLGEATGRIIAVAREAAAETVAKAEESAARVVKEAHDDAARLREEAESVLARRTEHAEIEANKIRASAEEVAAATVAAAEGRAAELEAAANAIVEKAKAEVERIATEAAEAATAELEAARATGREMVHEAQAVRERVLRDLSRKRKTARVQLEQLRAGRDRLLQAYDVVRRTLDEATDELRVALNEAKFAADAAARRVEAEPEPDIEALEAEVEAARMAGLPLVTDDAVEVDEVAEVAEVDESIAGDEIAVDEGALPPLPDEIPPAPQELAPVAPPRAKKRRGVPELPPVEYKPLTPPDPVEGMRVITGEQPVVEVASVEIEVEIVDDVPAEDVPPDDGPGVDVEPAASVDVDDLFARLRAERAEEVAKAEQVLATDEVGDEATTEAVEPAPDVVEEDQAEAATTTDDEALLERRDGALEPIDARLARKLKRALADEQNDALDKLRRAKGTVDVAQLLGTAEEHAARYAEPITDELRDAAAAGARLVDADATVDVNVDAAARVLGSSLVGPLRERIDNALRAASGDDDAAADGVRACYREWKAQRLGPLGEDVVHHAFNLGVVAASGRDTKLRWIVDNGGSPCPDAEDNALAGAVTCGEQFPTGHCHPPAHPGCRCLVVPAATTT